MINLLSIKGNIVFLVNPFATSLNSFILLKPERKNNKVMKIDGRNKEGIIYTFEKSIAKVYTFEKSIAKVYTFIIKIYTFFIKKVYKTFTVYLDQNTRIAISHPC